MGYILRQSEIPYSLYRSTETEVTAFLWEFALPGYIWSAPSTKNLQAVRGFASGKIGHGTVRNEMGLRALQY